MNLFESSIDFSINFDRFFRLFTTYLACFVCLKYHVISIGLGDVYGEYERLVLSSKRMNECVYFACSESLYLLCVWTRNNAVLYCTVLHTRSIGCLQDSDHVSDQNRRVGCSTERSKQSLRVDVGVLRGKRPVFFSTL